MLTTLPAPGTRGTLVNRGPATYVGRTPSMFAGMPADFRFVTDSGEAFVIESPSIAARVFTPDAVPAMPAATALRIARGAERSAAVARFWETYSPESTFAVIADDDSVPGMRAADVLALLTWDPETAADMVGTLAAEGNVLLPWELGSLSIHANTPNLY